MLAGKRILLIVGGGIVACRSPELIACLREHGAEVDAILTKAAEAFVTPLSVSLSAGREAPSAAEISAAVDAVLVAPATPGLVAKMATGHADDPAVAMIMAAEAPILLVPSMDSRMWNHPATQRNLTQLRADGVHVLQPAEGPDAQEIPGIVHGMLAEGPLKGRHVIVTSGPTHEPIDPVRYIANRSSGAQGTAVAAALIALGAEVSFVTGPAQVPPPRGARVLRVETAREMQQAVLDALPADAAVFAAAVADWRVANASGSKMKKDGSGRAPSLEFAENPDILAQVAQMQTGRPRLVVGFAAETEDVFAHATAKRARKGCDWIVANDVSPASGIMGGKENAVTVISEAGAESWPRMGKDAVAARLAAKIAEALA